MDAADLIFGLPADYSLPASLTFGDDGTPSIPDAPVAILGRLPGLRGPARVAVGRLTSICGALPRLRGPLVTRYNSGTERPIVNDTTGRFQQGVAAPAGSRSAFQDSMRYDAPVAGVFRRAQGRHSSGEVRWQDAARLPAATTGVFGQGARAGALLQAVFEDAARVHRRWQALFQDAAHLQTAGMAARWQDALRDRRNLAAARFQRAAQYLAGWRDHGGPGAFLAGGWHSGFQQARRPPIGRWVPPVTPEPGASCYDPALPAHLVFDTAWSGTGHLIFVCERKADPGKTVVVPVREVYLTINSASLVRLDTGTPIPATRMSMALDVDSWTWTFSASVPGRALEALEPNRAGDPVILHTVVNGTAFRFVADGLARERQFGSSQLRVTGRGLAAELDAPYAPVLSFTNTEARTGRQLLDDILTYNGASIGWAIGGAAFTDWNVPAGVFNHNGTYISALNAVVGAIGAYVQPHNTDRALNVLLRYPVPSWAWADVTPDIELPAAVTARESIEWSNKPAYNRVFVVGQEQGVIGQYTRAGTAGDLLAPTVVDPLITEAPAARQRGRAILSDTGRVASVTLRLPVLAETGVIPPGKFIRYVDGGEQRIGLSRSVSLDVTMPTIYQTIAVETHVEPV